VTPLDSVERSAWRGTHPSHRAGTDRSAADD
jgi:hypothetical protein